MSAQPNSQANEEVIKPQNQVITYTAPWFIYALSFSNRTANRLRLGIASFVPSIKNEVQIIQYSEKQTFQKLFSFHHQYPPSKLLFMPPDNNSRPDLFATSGQTLKIWEIVDDKEVIVKHELKNENDFCAPLTSFDWNPTYANLLGTSSIDATCTIWDLEKTTQPTQIIAHDKEVNDIHFSKDPNKFASVGSDGSVRLFDIRNLQHSQVLYETEKTNPVLKLAWNRSNNSHYQVAIIELCSQHITIIDERKISVPLCQLRSHGCYVNGMAWDPQKSNHLCSIGDDKKAYIWQLGNTKGFSHSPFLEYQADEKISNISWSLKSPDWLAICYTSHLQMLKL